MIIGNIEENLAATLRRVISGLESDEEKAWSRETIGFERDLTLKLPSL